MMTKKHGQSLAMVIVTSCIAVASIVALATATIIDRVMAVVAGRIITLSDVRAAIDLGLVDTTAAADPIGAALRKLIARQLLLDEVNRYAAPEPPASQIEARLQAIRRRFPNSESLARALEGLGITEGHLHDLVRDDLRIESYLDQRFQAAARPTDQEVEDYYREHEGELVRDGRPVPRAEAIEMARSRLEEARRRSMIDDWVARLRRRTEVAELYIGPA